MKKVYLFIGSLILLLSVAKSQDTVVTASPKSKNVFLIKVISIDTLILVAQDYLSVIGMPEDNFKTVRVKAEVLSCLEGEFNEKRLTIMMDMSVNEHNCLYSFSQGSCYKVILSAFRYLSSEILRKYRKKYFRIDCFYPPLVLH